MSSCRDSSSRDAVSSVSSSFAIGSRGGLIIQELSTWAELLLGCGGRDFTPVFRKPDLEPRILSPLLPRTSSATGGRSTEGRVGWDFILKKCSSTTTTQQPLTPELSTAACTTGTSPPPPIWVDKGRRMAPTLYQISHVAKNRQL